METGRAAAILAMQFAGGFGLVADRQHAAARWCGRRAAAIRCDGRRAGRAARCRPGRGSTACRHCRRRPAGRPGSVRARRRVVSSRKRAVEFIVITSSGICAGSTTSARASSACRAAWSRPARRRLLEQCLDALAVQARQQQRGGWEWSWLLQSRAGGAPVRRPHSRDVSATIAPLRKCFNPPVSRGSSCGKSGGSRRRVRASGTAPHFLQFHLSQGVDNVPDALQHTRPRNGSRRCGRPRWRNW